MSQQLHACGRLAAALGLTRRALEKWAAAGLLRPARVGTGAKTLFAFDQLDVLTAALIVELRRRGFGLALIQGIANWLRQQSLDSLQDDWREGRKLLLAVGGAEPLPRLLSRADVFDNAGIDLPAALAAGVPVAVVDLEQAYRQLSERLAKSYENRDRKIEAAVG